MSGLSAPAVRRTIRAISVIPAGRVGTLLVLLALLSWLPANAANGWTRRNFDLGGTSHYSVRATRNSGDLKQLWSLAGPANPAVLTEDLNGDGVIDIATSDGTTLKAYRGNGSVLWAVAASGTLSYIGDVDGDAAPELCLGRLSGTTLIVDVYNANGTFDRTLSRTGSGESSSVQVLGSVGTDLLVGYWAGIPPTPRGFGILGYATGAERTSYLTGGGGAGGCFAVGDPDQDGALEIAMPWATVHNYGMANGTTDFDLFGVMAEWTPGSGTCSAQFSLPTTAWYASATPDGELSAMMADLGGGGGVSTFFLEAHSVAYPGQDHIYRVNAAGTCVARWDGGTTKGWALPSTVIGDVNADGVRELAVSTWQVDQRLTVIDGQSLTTLYSQPGGGAIYGSADFDGDGVDELIVHCASDATLRVLDSMTFVVEGKLAVGPGFHTPAADFVNRFAISDVNGDGALELVAGLGTGLAVLGPTAANCPSQPVIRMGEYQLARPGMSWDYRNEYPPYDLFQRSVFEALSYEGHAAVKIGQPDSYDVVAGAGRAYTIYAQTNGGVLVDLPRDIVLGDFTDGTTYTVCAGPPCDINLVRDWDAIDPALRAPFGLDAHYGDLVLIAVYDSGVVPNSKNLVVESNLPACTPRPAGAVTSMVWYQRALGAVAGCDIQASTGDIDGGFYKLSQVSGVDDGRALPAALVLEQNTPNPFNPRTTIRYDLPGAGPVRLAVFDIAGRLVRTLVDDGMPAGSHEAVWDGRDALGREVGSGSYLARLEFGGKVETVRMGLIR